jgi:hypothetical protein
MPQVQVKTPDGSVLTVNAPDGASQQQIFAFAKSQYDAMQLKKQQVGLEEQVVSFDKNAPLEKFVGNVDAGIVKSVGGMVQTASDAINKLGIRNNIGAIIGNKTNQIANVFGSKDGNGGLGQSIGQMVPYMLGGEIGAAAKGATFAAKFAARGAVGAVAGATSLKDEPTAQGREADDLDSAVEGFGVGGGLGAAGDVVGKGVGQLKNSKALDRAFNSIVASINEWKPDASEVAKDVGSRFNAMNAQYQIRMKRFDGLVNSIGGVDLKNAVEPVMFGQKILPKITNDDPGKGMLAKVVNVLQQFSPEKGKDYDSVMKQFGTQGLNPTLKAQLEKQGLQIDPVVKPAPGGVVAQLSENIDSFLKKQKGNVTSQASIALSDIKKGLDSGLNSALDQSPAARRVWNGIQNEFMKPIEPLKSGMLVNLLSQDPELQRQSIGNVLKNGDEATNEGLAKMLSPDSKKQVVNMAMHDAVAESYDDNASHINAAKFQKKINGVKDNLAKYMTPEDKRQFYGMMNFIRADAHAKPGKGIFGRNSGTWATNMGIFDAVKDTLGGFAMGHINLLPIGKALGAAAGVRVLTHGIDVLANSVVGKNFFNAASEVKPEGGAWDQLLTKWMPRLTRTLTLAFVQDRQQSEQYGQKVQRAKGSIGIPFPPQQ